MDKMRMESVDITDQNIDKIGALFPNVITETKDENGKLTKAINFEILKQELSKEIIDGDEAYEFTWVGKKAAIVDANKPIRKTLRPCKEESVNWDTTENLYIEGDNLEVLKLLQESYLGKVKMIYIDPPYNTGNDFIYEDDFAQSREDYDEYSGTMDENGNRMFKNTDSNGRFHSDWCSMMYPRLSLARNLLAEDGSMFISIDDNEQATLKMICDLVFGSSNYVGMFSVENNPKGRKNGKFISVTNEYCLIYVKNYDVANFNKTIPKEASDMIEDENGDFVRRSGKRVLMGENSLNKRVTNFNSKKHYSAYIKDADLILKKEKELSSPDKKLLNMGYRRYVTFLNDYFVENTYTDDKFVELFNNGALDIREDKIYEKHFSDNKQIKSLLTNTAYEAVRNNKQIHYELDLKTTSAKRDLINLMGNDVFSFPKNTSFISHLIDLNSNADSIILDFFSGSAATADAVMQLNAEDNGKRKFIMVQLPETCHDDSEAYKSGYKNICEIGKERIRRAAKKIHKEHPDAKFDDGFRVLKVDESNMTDVYYSVDSYDQTMLTQLESNIKLDRTELDLLFGCLLEWGLPLSMPYTSEDINGCTIHVYNDGDLIACFNNDIPESVIKEIAKRKPLRAVFRDSGFKGSPEKINVGETFKLLSPDTRVKII